jgi:hypothetical protein
MVECLVPTVWADVCMACKENTSDPELTVATRSSAVIWPAVVEGAELPFTGCGELLVDRATFKNDVRSLDLTLWPTGPCR